MLTRAALIALVTLAATAAQPAPKPVPDSQLGLAKVSPFEAPAPEAFAWPTVRPGKSEVLPRAFPGAPPQVPHRVARYLPITRDDNGCVNCHDDTDAWGEKLDEGDAVPMPSSHYVKVAGEDGETLALSGRRYVCVQCHVPQADLPDLVANTFGAAKRK